MSDSVVAPLFAMSRQWTSYREAVCFGQLGRGLSDMPALQQKDRP